MLEVPLEQLDQSSVVAAAGLIRDGRVYDLDSGRWHGMVPPTSPHPPFQVLTYRTPQGVRNQQDQEWMGANAAAAGWVSELMIGSAHTGTHIDALGHVTCGHDDRLFGGVAGRTAVGDFGLLEHDVSSIPPIVTRGVLVDAAKAAGVDALQGATPVTADLLRRALTRQDVELRRGDVVLVRTGWMKQWPFVDAGDPGIPGLTIDAAEFLMDRGAVAVGADNPALELGPSPDPDNPMPVHVSMLVERGVFILEYVFCEELAADSVYEFCFVCLPLKIRGATGSMVRPIAIT